MTSSNSGGGGGGGGGGGAATSGGSGIRNDAATSKGCENQGGGSTSGGDCTSGCTSGGCSGGGGGCGESISKELVMKSLTRWPNHPKEGITFLDVCPLVNQPLLFQLVIDWMVKQVPPQTTRLVSPDARGFLFAAPVALACKLPLVPARKPGKLPGPVITESYSLEYCQSGLLCMQESVVQPGDQIFAIDDILATGGTIAALKRLVLKQNAQFLGGACLLDIKQAKKDAVCREVNCWIPWDGGDD